MIKRKKKPCVGCGRESYIFSKDRCRDCARMSYSKPKQSPIKKKIPKATGELALFQAIWNTRPHICQVSGNPIKEFDVRCFMHVLSKKAYPAYRLFDKNILLVTPDIHHEYDCGDRSKPIFDKVRKLHDQLIESYYKKKPDV